MTDEITSLESELEEDLDTSNISQISSKEKVKQKKGISRPLCKEDFYAFICILLLSSICPKNSFSSMWLTNPYETTPIFSKIISVCIHISNCHQTILTI
jgi:hypothetical protein